MNDPMLAIEQILAILEDAPGWEKPGQLAAYSCIMILLRDLREYVESLGSIDIGYAVEKIVEAEWHVGAMFGLDVDNGKPVTQHHVWALGSLQTLSNVLQQAH